MWVWGYIPIRVEECWRRAGFGMYAVSCGMEVSVIIPAADRISTTTYLLLRDLNRYGISLFLTLTFRER